MKLTTCMAVLLAAVSASAMPAGRATAAEAAAEKLPRLYLIALRSSDIERSVKFYTTGLGMALVGRVDTDTITEVSFGYDKEDTQAPRIVLRKSKPADPSPVRTGDPAETIVLRVPNVAAITESVTKAGFKAVAGPDHPKYKIIDVVDPDGHAFRVMEMRPAAQ